MSTSRKTSLVGWIGLALLLISAGAAASQSYPQREQHQVIDQLRVQRQLSDQRLGEDLRLQQELQRARSEQLRLEERIRRQQLQDQIERRQR
jgi:hypothetical protein